ncbi:hypothetical protein NKH77_27815 [Streptomyces sp. M19]
MSGSAAYVPSGGIRHVLTATAPAPATTPAPAPPCRPPPRHVGRRRPDAARTRARSTTVRRTSASGSPTCWVTVPPPSPGRHASARPPGWLPMTLLGAGLAVGTVQATLAALRAQRGVTGPEAVTGQLLGAAWITAFAALFLAITGLAAAVDNPDIQTLLWPTGSGFVVGLLYVAEGSSAATPPLRPRHLARPDLHRSPPPWRPRLLLGPHPRRRRRLRPRRPPRTPPPHRHPALSPGLCPSAPQPLCPSAPDPGTLALDLPGMPGRGRRQRAPGPEADGPRSRQGKSTSGPTTEGDMVKDTGSATQTAPTRQPGPATAVEGGRLREEIIDAAAELLDETGDQHAVTLRSVARRVGIATPRSTPTSRTSRPSCWPSSNGSSPTWSVAWARRRRVPVTLHGDGSWPSARPTSTSPLAIPSATARCSAACGHRRRATAH